MSTKLTIEIDGPLDDTDQGLIGGIAMVLYALVQQSKDEAGQETDVEDEEEPDVLDAARQQMHDYGHLAETPEPCGKREVGTTRMCVGMVGHRGRHLYRQMAAMN